MKFAKYQANNLIPEWRMKYLDVFYVSRSYADRKQYKKGKKLLKEVKKARLRQRPSSTRTPRLPNGNEINGEYGRTTPRSSIYSRNNKPEKSPRQLSPNLKPPKYQSESNGSGGVSTLDRVQERMTSDSVGPGTHNCTAESDESLWQSISANFKQISVKCATPFLHPVENRQSRSSS